MKINEKLPIIGFSIGDYHGIGIEIFLKYLKETDWKNRFIVVFFGPSSVIKYYSQFLNIPAPAFFIFNSHKEVKAQVINISSIFEESIYTKMTAKILPGKMDVRTAPLTLFSLEKSVEYCLKKWVSALVTLPINKEILQNNSFKFPGHTEYLQKKTRSNEVLMLMYHPSIKIATLTGHIPLKKVSSSLNIQQIKRKIQLLYQLLKNDFKIKNPNIALLGVNPHAGENGKLGDEESVILAPIIKHFKKEKIKLDGPFPADGFFGSGNWKNYDAILSTYHDQGLIPFKLIAFDAGVNFTCGLPITRTSPAHGTAYSIVGKNIANYSSLSEAINLAISLKK